MAGVRFSCFRILPTVLLSILGIPAGLALGETPEERLKACLLEEADLLPGWSIRNGTGSDDRQAQLSEKFQAMLQGEAYAGIVFRSQRVGAGGSEFGLFTFVAPDEWKRQGLKGGFETNAATWSLRFFEMFDAVYMTQGADEGALAALRNACAGRHAAGPIARAGALLAEHKDEEADKSLSALLAAIPDNGPACVRAGDLYIRSFSPPRPDRALELFAKALEIHGKTALPPYELWAAHAGSAAVHEAKNDSGAAAVAWAKAAEAAAKVGPRLQARTGLRLACAQAAARKPDDCFLALKQSFEADASFGCRGAADEAREEKALAPLLVQDRFKALFVKAPKTTREAFGDPSAKKADLDKAGVLILPPAVLAEGGRNADLEAAVEKALLSKFGKRGLAFGEKRDGLVREGIDGIAPSLCGHAAEAVLGQSVFSLLLYSGNRHRIAGTADRARDAARSIAKSPTTHVLATMLEPAQGEGSLPSTRVTAVLLACGTGRISAFVRYEMKCPPEGVKAQVSSLASEIFRRMDDAMRKG